MPNDPKLQEFERLLDAACRVSASPLQAHAANLARLALTKWAAEVVGILADNNSLVSKTFARYGVLAAQLAAAEREGDAARLQLVEETENAVVAERDAQRMLTEKNTGESQLAAARELLARAATGIRTLVDHVNAERPCTAADEARALLAELDAEKCGA